MAPWPSRMGALASVIALVAMAGVLTILNDGPPQEAVRLTSEETEELMGKGKPAFCGGSHRIPPVDAKRIKGWNLKQVSLFIRHGDRTRCGFQGCWAKDTAMYNCDLGFLERPSMGQSSATGRTYKKRYMKGRYVLPGACRLGQLTPIGYKQHYLNGKLLRETYSKLLPKSYVGHESEFALRSDDMPRTVLSGQALFNGMYPQQPKEAPADWFVMDHVRENMFPNFHVCPRLNRAVKEAKARPEFKRHWETVHKPLHRKLSKLMGKTAHIGHIRDCLVTHICHKQAVPKPLRQILPSLQAEIARHYDLVARHTRKYAGGPLVAEVLAQLKQAVKGESPYKFMLYSGHDTGPILPLLHSFKVADGKWPPYASTIALELYESDNKKDHMLRMVYNGKEMKIPGCGGGLCPWKKFAAIAQKVSASKKDCIDMKYGAKLIHWDGMFSEIGRQDMLGRNEKSSSPLQF